MARFYTDWSALQPAEEIKFGRYFEYDQEALQFFQEKLSFLLSKNISVLEIGAGSGFFTEKLLKLNPDMNLTCLEPDSSFSILLQRKFKEISIINDIVENLSTYDHKFDVVISHIVIHNVLDPLRALKEMKAVTKEEGYVVCIEPLPSGRHYLPDKQVQEAMELLEQVKKFQSIERNKKIQIRKVHNPWTNNYPQLFQKSGISFKHAYGWTSVFTLSDDRYDFNERIYWIKLRKNFYLSNKDSIYQTLVQNGITKEKIESSFDCVMRYFENIEKMKQEELRTVHEQEIVHRIICIGQNRKIV